MAGGSGAPHELANAVDSTREESPDSTTGGTRCYVRERSGRRLGAGLNSNLHPRLPLSAAGRSSSDTPRSDPVWQCKPAGRDTLAKARTSRSMVIRRWTCRHTNACRQGSPAVQTDAGQAHVRARCRKIQTYPAIRIAKNTSISIRPNNPSTSYWIAHGSRKIVSTSKMTKRIATR